MASFFRSSQFKRLIKQAKPIIDQSINQSIRSAKSNQSKSGSTNQSTNQSSNRYKLIGLAGAGILAVIGYVIEQSTNRPTNRATNQSINATPVPTSASASLPVLLVDPSIDQSTHPVLSTFPFTYGWPHLPYQQSTNQSIDQSIIDASQLAYPVYVKQNYVSSWNPRLKIADWCIEVLTRRSANQSTNQSTNQSLDRTKCDFHSEKSINQLFRPSVNDYSPPYDRGHLVPAGDTKLNQSINQSVIQSTNQSMLQSMLQSTNQSNNVSQSAMNDTFNLINIAPQHRGLNRKYWRSFEGWIRDLTHKNHKVIVVTGPLILNHSTNQSINQSTNQSINQVQYELLPPTNPMIAVPTHFYKIVIIEKNEKDNEPIIGGFILPNKPIPQSINLSTFVAPIQSIEQSTGYLFFPKLTRSMRQSFNRESDICSRISCDLTAQHKKFEVYDSPKGKLTN